MKKILVFQHVPYEILGTLNPLLKEARFRIRYVNFGHHPDAQPSLSGYQGLIILGGPMNVDEVDKHPHLIVEAALIKEAIAKDIPVLGICLGAQLIAKTLGAKVYANPDKEIGWYDVSLTAAGRNDKVLVPFGTTEKIFQMHGDAYELPDGALNLAATATCEQQAFCYGDKVYGFQFHLEADLLLIERWLRILNRVDAMRALGIDADLQRIRIETNKYIAQMQVLSYNTFSNFIRLFDLPERPVSLSSR